MLFQTVFIFYRGLNDVTLSALSEAHWELNDIHSRSVIIPPQNHLSVSLSRDPSIDVLSLLFPLNATSKDLHKDKLTAAERAKITEFSYSLQTEPAIVKR